MSPQTGDIWQYTFAKGRNIVSVLVMEKDDEWLDTWTCLSLDNGEYSEWYFGEAAMKDWRKLV